MNEERVPSRESMAVFAVGIVVAVVTYVLLSGLVEQGGPGREPPPGVFAEVDQYTETAVQLTGTRPLSPTGGDGISARQRRALERLGVAGDGITQLSQVGPLPDRSEAPPRGERGGEGDDGNTGSIALALFDGWAGGGLGILLPLIVAVLLGGGVAYAIWRWRSRPPSGAT